MNWRIFSTTLFAAMSYWFNCPLAAGQQRAVDPHGVSGPTIAGANLGELYLNWVYKEYWENTQDDHWITPQGEEDSLSYGNMIEQVCTIHRTARYDPDFSWDKNFSTFSRAIERRNGMSYPDFDAIDLSRFTPGQILASSAYIKRPRAIASEGTVDFDNGNYYKYQYLEAGATKIRLERPNDEVFEQSFNWLKVTEGASEAILSIEPLRLTIPARRRVSPEAELSPKEPNCQMFLLPVLLRDVKDHNKSEDDMNIDPWDPAHEIAYGNIAWIEAHSSDVDIAPRMPQLEFSIPYLPEGIMLEAKFEVHYIRGNGARPARGAPNGTPSDQVNIPVSGGYQAIVGDTWRIWEMYANQPFFGGDATITYRLVKGSNQILAPQTIHFRIGGKNPDPARAKSYIMSLADCGDAGSLWFAYAIARSESKDYNGAGSRYNQFWQLPGGSNTNRAVRRVHAGRPLWGNDGGATPGGYGLFQVTGNVNNSNANIPRAQIWNWQENVIAARLILVDKRRAATNWMTKQMAHANGVFPPSHTVANVTFDGGNHTMTHACNIKAYNGASKPPSDIDSENLADFVTDPTYPSIGHYCYWHFGQKKWGLCRFNDRGFNYVQRVCVEVES